MPKRKYLAEGELKILSMPNIRRANGEYEYTIINLATGNREEYYRLPSGKMVKFVCKATENELRAARIERFTEKYKAYRAEKAAQKEEVPTL